MRDKDNGFIVKPRSRVSLRTTAKKVRQAFAIEGPLLDIVHLLDVDLPSVYEEFEYHIHEDSHMGNDLARTIPEKQLIQVQQSVDERARQFVGRDRFTLAHELGHLVLHQDVDLGLSRRATDSDKVYKCSEWQANTFAGELLIPHEHVYVDDTIDDLIDRFKVSSQVAEIQINVFRREGLIKKKQ